MKTKKLLIIGIIFVMVVPMISYAINIPSNNKSFFSSNKKEISQNEKLILSLDLNQIQYDEFEFTLTSSSGVNNITTQTADVEITNNSDSFKMIVNKSNLNISNLDLYYQIPENAEVGSEITFKGIIKENNPENEEENKQETTITVEIVENKEDDSKEENVNSKPNENEQNNQENSSKPNNDNQINNQDRENKKDEFNSNSDKDEPKMGNAQNNQQMNSQNTENKSQTGTKTSSNSLSKTDVSMEETNTYNGESNNYLSKLEISNLNVQPNFSKTNTTYFLEVEDSITELSITAETEDSNAQVSIYGNDNLQQGKNKVLISVTAENGSMKTYRLYVTRK